MKITFFPHDCAASSDHKLVELEAMHGSIAYAVFFKAIEILHTCQDGELEFQRLSNGIRGIMKGDASMVEAVLESCLTFDLLMSKKVRGRGVRTRILTSDRVQRNVNRCHELRDKRRTAALRGAELRQKMSANAGSQSEQMRLHDPANKIRSDQIKLNEIKLDQIKDKERETKPVSTKPNSESQSIPKPCLIKYGKDYFRTTAEHYEKLVEKFSRPLLEQELENMDEWITLSDKPTARKYRKPTSDHYLFACNWLKDKKLKYTAKATNGGSATGESEFIKSIRESCEYLGISEEFPNGFIKKKETTDA